MHCAFISPSSDIHLSRKLHGAWNGSRLYEYRISTSVSHNLPLSSAQDILWSTFDLGASSHPMQDRTLFIPVAVPRMLSFQEFLLTITFCLYSASSALECYSGILPDLADCQILIGALYDLSRMPGQNDPKEYGRTMESSIYSEKIPKVFYLSGPEDYNCALFVDVEITDYYAIDTFRIQDLAWAANAVFAVCLVTEGRLGQYVYRILDSAGSASKSVIAGHIPQVCSMYLQRSSGCHPTLIHLTVQT